MVEWDCGFWCEEGFVDDEFVLLCDFDDCAC